MAADLRECVGQDDRRATLCALRDHIIRDMTEAAEPKYTAALAGRLVEVLAEIDALPTGEETSTVDDLANRRAARRANTAVPDRPAGAQ